MKVGVIEHGMLICDEIGLYSSIFLNEHVVPPRLCLLQFTDTGIYWIYSCIHYQYYHF